MLAVAGVLCTVGSFGLWEYAKQAEQAKETQAKQLAYEEFIKNHPYSNRKYANKQQYKAAGLPKKDRPDWAMEQDFLRTFDPATGDVPRERLFAETEKLQTYFKSIKGGRTEAATAANWYEKGPNNIGGRTRAIMFDPNDPFKKKAWAGAVGGGLWYNNDLTDANSSWTKVNDLWDNIAISSIAYDPSNTQIFYATTGEAFFGSDAQRGAGIWKTTDGGVTWNRLASTTTSAFRRIVKAVVNNSGHIFVATQSLQNSGGILRSTDGGANWTVVLAPFSGVGVAANTLEYDFASDIEIAQNGDIYAACGTFFNTTANKGIVMRSVDNGANWTAITPTTGGYRIELAIAPSTGATTAATTIYAIGADDGNAGNIVWFRKSVNGGATWTTIAVPKYYNQNCTVSTTDFTRGQSWYDLILAVHPTDPNTVFAGGIDVHRTTNGGTSWSPMSYWTGNCYSYVHADIHNIIFRPTDVNTLMIGCDGGVFYSSNANAGTPTFAARNKNYNVTQFYAAAMKNISADNFFAAGAQDNGSLVISAAGIKRTRDGAEATGGDGGFCFVDQTDPNTVITAYTNNVYYVSTDGGASFADLGTQDQSTGSFINPCDFTTGFLYSYRGTSTTPSAGIRRWTVPGGTPTNMTITGATNMTHIKVSPHASTTVFVGTATGKVYKATNMTTAPTTKTPTDLTASGALATGSVSCIEVGASENELLVTLSNYGIKSVWYTANGGTTWTSKDETGYGLPDIPVRWALMNPNNRQEVLIATELGVWATDNITAANPNWTPVNSTLANTRIDMLKYRTADGLVLAATHGRGLFVSDVFVPTPIVGFFAENVDQPHPFATKDALVLYQNATDPIQFYDNSLGNITTYSWNFGAGATPATATTVGPHNVTYSSIGKKTVALTVNGSLTSTQTNYLHILPYKTTLPYTLAGGGDFETTPDDFGVSNKGVTWQRGNSAVAGKDGVVSGSNAWVTGLTGSYGSSATSYLFTPNYNMNLAGVYNLSFSTKFATEAGYDGFIVEYTLDKGKNWQTLSPAVAAGWYNTVGLSGAAFGTGAAFFTGTQSTYATMSRDISSLAGNTNVAFRFTFKSDSGVNGAGVAIDDFQITFTPTAPTITSFTPISGGVDTEVTLIGTNLVGTTAVSIGGVAARSFTVINNTTIKAITNDGFATGTIIVTTPNGSYNTTVNANPNKTFTRTGCTHSLSTLNITNEIHTTDFAGIRVSWTNTDVTPDANKRILMVFKPANISFWTARFLPNTANTFLIGHVEGAVAYEFYLQTLCNNITQGDRVFLGTTFTPTLSGNKTCATPLLPLTFNVATGGQITCSWAAVTNAVQYQVMYQQCDAAGNFIAAGQQAYVATNSWTVTGLIPNAYYRFRVKSVCQANNSINTPFNSFVVQQAAASGAEKDDKEGTVVKVVEQKLELIDFAVYPNPATDQITLSFMPKLGTNESLTHLQIVDLTGRELLQLNNPANETTLDLKNFAKGVYLIKATTTKGEVMARKLVVE